MTRLLFRVTLLALLFLAIPRSASADPASDAADLKAQGDDAMQRIEYEKALDLYNRAYALDPAPALLYNRGRAYEALARYPEALDQLEEFERTAPDELKAKVKKLDELLARVRAKVSELEVKANVDGARVLLRAKVVGTTPLGKPLRVNAGKAVVEVSKEGYHPFRRTVALTGGGKLTLDAELFSKSKTGVLTIGSPVAGATVFIDGKRLGIAPVQTALSAGRHRVVVRHEDYDEADTSVEMVAGTRNRIDVPLDKPTPVVSRWWFWTGVGVVVVSGAVLTYALLTERSADKGDIPPGQVSGPLMRF